MVKVKGNATCCRDDCQGQVLPDLKCCCDTVCDAICVTIKMDGCPDYCPDEDGCDSDCGCHCATAELPWDCDLQAYVGALGCGGMVIDLKFSLVECEYGCRLCLSSDCLGIYGDCDTDDCVAISGKAQCTGCVDGIVRTGGMVGSWAVDLSACGNAYCGGATIETECVERILPSRSVDCGIPLCLGCECACRCICITYRDDTCDETVKACWDNEIGGWSASIECPYETIEITISLGPNEYTDECELSLSTSIGDGDAMAPGCPDISASWTITKEDSSTATIDVICSDCGNCDIFSECECDGTLLPATLTATITNINKCSGLDGETITLVWDGVDTWSGTKDICGDDWTVLLRCPAGAGGACGDFELSIQSDVGAVCHVSKDGPPDSGCSCDPVLFCLTDVEVGGACPCCEDVEDPYLPDPDNKVKVCVTE